MKSHLQKYRVQQQGSASRFLPHAGAPHAVFQPPPGAPIAPGLGMPGALHDMDLADEDDLLEALRLSPSGVGGELPLPLGIASENAWPEGTGLEEWLTFPAAHAGAAGGGEVGGPAEHREAPLDLEALSWRLQPRSLAEMLQPGAEEVDGGHDASALGWPLPELAPQAAPQPPPLPVGGAALSAALQTTLREQQELHRQLQAHMSHTRALEAGLAESGRRIEALVAAAEAGGVLPASVASMPPGIPWLDEGASGGGGE